MVHAVMLGRGHEISDDRARLDMAFVHASLATVYWGVDRSPAMTERSFAILGHPELTTVSQWTLTTADAHRLYARFGFHVATQPGWMILERGTALAVPTG